ncbi:MAG: glycosyltransferase family 1 protein [Patescibacteria group bacterium]|jgi:glycosyltransferase involved in cell wall biosynthesis
MDKVFVYDPTASDKLSSVRGIGRYLQILKENFADEFEFVSNLSSIIHHPSSIFINPFFNFLQPPVWTNNYWSLHKRIARKQIAVIHDLIPLKYPDHFPAGMKGSIYILLNKLALKNYDLIITDSEASKRDIIKILKIKDQKVEIIYPCLPKNFINSKSELRTANFCLYVGDATWNKNLVNLARAIKIANVTCLFVGKVFQTSAVEERSGKTTGVNNGWQKEFKEFINEIKDDKRFIFAGFVPDSELIKLYQQASLNILPSQDEGFGFSYLEAAQFSCPSVLSDIPVLKEISGGNSLFADPENPQDLADKIGEIYFNKNLRNEIGIKAKKRAEYFSSKKFKRDFLSAIK